MKYRLGLDLGTNSIGWSVYSLDDENSPIKLEDLGVIEVQTLDINRKDPCDPCDLFNNKLINGIY